EDALDDRFVIQIVRQVEMTLRLVEADDHSAFLDLRARRGARSSASGFASSVTPNVCSSGSSSASRKSPFRKHVSAVPGVQLMISARTSRATPAKIAGQCRMLPQFPRPFG